MLRPLRIRLATVADCGLLWVWANDPVVRQNSFNGDPIRWVNHVHWFYRKLGEDAIHIVTDGAGDPMGVVRFDYPNGQPEISVTVCSAWRGKGYGHEVIQMGSEAIDVRPITARIKQENIASIKAFTKAGYKLIGTTEQVVYMHLTNPRISR